MLIEKLIILETKPQEEIIRNVSFNLNGLNLITDVTPNISTKSGNSVGKSTVLKVIDICFGSQTLKKIYYDSDTDSTNDAIKSFLKIHKVIAQLHLLDNNKKIVIERGLYPNNRHYYIDGKKCSNFEDYKQQLKIILFKSNTEKPTVRQLLKRFIRLNNKQLENVIDFISSGYQAREVLESLHLTLLNAVESDTIDEKMRLEQILRDTNSYLKSFTRENNIKSLASLRQRVTAINLELSEKINQRSQIDYIEEYKEELAQKSTIQEKLDIIFSNIQSINFDISMINESLENLHSDKTNISTNDLNSLYKEVEGYVSSLGQKFDDLVKFHNNMIESRINFIKMQKDEKIEQLAMLEKQQEVLLIEKQKLSKDLVNEGLLTDLHSINAKIDNLNVNKGEVKKLIDIYKKYNDIITETNVKLDNLNTDNSIDQNIAIFNKHLSSYSKMLYDESYHLVYNDEWKSQTKGHPFSIENIKGNVGDGKKRGLVVAFDLAYLSFIEELDIPFPNFIVHDKMEMVHINQLRTIFNMCSDINGQYIVPIIKERISLVDEDVVERATILELSEEDKLFKVGNSSSINTTRIGAPVERIINPADYQYNDYILNSETHTIASNHILFKQDIVPADIVDNLMSYASYLQTQLENYKESPKMIDNKSEGVIESIQRYLESSQFILEVLNAHKYNLGTMDTEILYKLYQRLIVLQNDKLTHNNSELPEIIELLMLLVREHLPLHLPPV